MSIVTGYFDNFLTNKRLFSGQFELAARNLVEMACMLDSITNLSPSKDFENLFKQVDQKQAAGGHITHKIQLCLSKIVFTPIDRPDIHALASGIDGIAGNIREAAGRMYLYHIDEFSRPVKELSAIILNACIEIQKTVPLLFEKKPTDLALARCQFKNYERAADVIYCKALGNLFSNENNAIKLLKYRDVLLSLDMSVKKCKTVTDVLNNIMIS